MLGSRSRSSRPILVDPLILAQPRLGASLVRSFEIMNKDDRVKGPRYHLEPITDLSEAYTETATGKYAGMIVLGCDDSLDTWTRLQWNGFPIPVTAPIREPFQQRKRLTVAVPTYTVLNPAGKLQAWLMAQEGGRGVVVHRASANRSPAVVVEKGIFQLDSEPALLVRERGALPDVIFSGSMPFMTLPLSYDEFSAIMINQGLPHGSTLWAGARMRQPWSVHFLQPYESATQTSPQPDLPFCMAIAGYYLEKQLEIRDGVIFRKWLQTSEWTHGWDALWHTHFPNRPLMQMSIA